MNRRRDMDPSRPNEELIAAVLAGEVDRDQPDVKALLAAEPGLIDALDRLEPTARRLEAAGAYRNRILAAAARSTDEQDPRLNPAVDVRGIVEGLAAGTARGEGSGHRDTGHRDTGHRDTGHRDTGHRDTGHRDTGHRDTGNRNTGHRDSGNRGRDAAGTRFLGERTWGMPRWLALAAALLILVAGALVINGPMGPDSPDPADGGDEILLGNRAVIALLVPADTAAAAATDFRWESSLPRPTGGYFEVRVYAGAEPAADRELTRSEHLTDTSWTPPAEESASWRGTICWEVRLYASSRRIGISEPQVRTLRP